MRHCCNFKGAHRCNKPAMWEFVRLSSAKATWRAACLECLALIQRNASPLDKLRVRPIEVGGDGERTRQRKRDLGVR